MQKFSYPELVVRHPLWFLCLPLLLASIALVGLAKLTTTPDNRIFFSEDNPQLQALEEMEATFAKSDNAFIAIEATDGSLFTHEIFTLLLEMTEEGWLAPFSSRVNSLANFQRITAVGDDIEIRPLIEKEAIKDGAEASAEYIADVQNYVMNKPALLNRMVSLDGKVTGVNIAVQKPENETQAVFEVVNFARDLIADYEQKYPNINFYLTGSVPYDAAFAEIPASDNRLLGPLMFSLILLIAGLSLRSLWSVVAVVVLIGLTVGVTLGLTGWVGASLNAGTAGAPVILLTLSVAYCVHVLVSLRQQMIAGLSQKAAIVESLRINLAPVAITSVTTAIGFLSLNFSDAPPFRQLGNMVALGVMVTFILSVTFLPAFFCFFKLRRPDTKAPMAKVMSLCAEFVISWRHILLPVSSVLILILALGSFRIVLDDNFLEYFDDRYRVRRDTDFIEAQLTGMHALEFPGFALSDVGVTEPLYLQQIEDFEEWLIAQPGVTSTVSIAEILRDLNQNMHGGDPEWHRLPDSRELAAQYLLLYEISLPAGLELTNQVDLTKSSSRVVALVRDASSADLRTLNSRAEQWLSDNITDREIVGTGLSLIFAYISERNIRSMLFGSLFALFGISLILIFALKSVRIGLLSLAPNLFPAAMALGAWGYFVGTAGLSVAIVVAVTLGIVVDDTVHFLSRYLHARRARGLSPEDAVRFTFSTVGIALWITSVTLIVGFSVLFLSGFKVTAEMGLLSAVTIAFALLADFLFLPPLLMKIDVADKK